jgi:hypothetical protein
MKDFRRDVVTEEFAKLSPEERKALLQRLPAEERLAGIPPEQRLHGIAIEEIEKYLKQRKKPNNGRKRKK